MESVEVLVAGDGWVPLGKEQVRAALQRSAFVHYYDLLETPRHRVAAIDLAAPSFLAAVPNFKKLLVGLGQESSAVTMPEALEETTRLLRSIPDGLDLWDWEDRREHRSEVTELFEAARRLFAEFGPPKLTKLLHLKRPMLIPILDDRVRRAWNPRASNQWTIDELVDVTFTMGKELGARRPGLDMLKATADAEGWPFNTLSRLRLYDIMFWWLTEDSAAS